MKNALKLQVLLEAELNKNLALDHIILTDDLEIAGYDLSCPIQRDAMHGVFAAMKKHGREIRLARITGNMWSVEHVNY